MLDRPKSCCDKRIGQEDIQAPSRGPAPVTRNFRGAPNISWAEDMLLVPRKGHFHRQSRACGFRLLCSIPKTEKVAVKSREAAFSLNEGQNKILDGGFRLEVATTPSCPGPKEPPLVNRSSYP